jgi:pimeloyl-ACP methyl ester carboxylesterase
VTKSEPYHVISPYDSETMTLPDGRTLGYGIYGSRLKRAKVVVAFHGTPGSRLNYRDLDSWGRKTDNMFIVPESPGHGLSTYKSKYTVLEHAEDVQTLMDYLGHRQYKTYGTSGGTPYALALNILASTNEVSGTFLVVPSSPPESPTPDKVLQDLDTRYCISLPPRSQNGNIASMQIPS